jgi:hypothetical protein
MAKTNKISMLETLEHLVDKHGVNAIVVCMIVVLVPAVILVHAGMYALLEREPYPQWYLIDAFLTLLAGLPVISLLLHYANRMNQQKLALGLALSKVRELESILPMCASCKKIRDDDGRWSDPDHYIRKHTNTQVSHGLCEACIEIALDSE